MSVKNYIFVFAAVIGVSWAEIATTVQPDQESQSTDLPSSLSPQVSDSTTLTPQINYSLPPELNQSQALGEMQDKLISTTKRRCDKYGGPDAFKKFSGAGQEFGNCISKLVNSTLLQKQIELAKTNGSVDDLFKGYCEKTPDFQTCVKAGIETVQVCLSPEEQKQMKTVELVAQELAKFICVKEGDRIALFIADGGPECVEKNQEELKICANETMAIQNNIGDDILDNGFISFDEAHCKQISSFQACAVKALENCDRPTTANIVESLFKYAKRSTPCNNFTVAEKPNAATGLVITTATIVTAFVATIML